MNKKTGIQLQFLGIKGWGGKRKGAGRPNLSGQVSHMKRPKIDIKAPLHITLRLREKLPSIRNRNLFKEFKKSVKRAKSFGFYVIHFSMQSNHIHLFCEAKNNKAVALGMRALAGGFAKHVRSYAAALATTKGLSVSRGSVFKGRYHLHILKNPREVKNALEYVLLNESKHRRLIEYVDPYSSGRVFQDWKKLLGYRFKYLIEADFEFFAKNQGPSLDLDAVLSPPQSWLAKRGWMREIKQTA